MFHWGLTNNNIGGNTKAIKVVDSRERDNRATTDVSFFEFLQKNSNTKSKKIKLLLEEYICEDENYKDERKKGRKLNNKQKLRLKGSFDMTILICCERTC